MKIGTQGLYIPFYSKYGVMGIYRVRSSSIATNHTQFEIENESKTEYWYIAGKVNKHNSYYLIEPNIGAWYPGLHQCPLMELLIK